MKINVTADDIKHGTARHCEQCPVARALQRVCVDSIQCQVTSSYAYATMLTNDKTIVWEHYLPMIVQVFIVDFDEGQPVEPFEFDLAIPEKYLCGQAA